MPYATNPDDGVRIYYEVAGSGPPLVLVHGFSTDLNWWKRDGYVAWQHLQFYVDVLKSDYQLVLIDPRGHGQSDKPHEVQAYAEQASVEDLVCVLDDLQITSSHFIGYSQGAITGWSFGAFNARRLRSLVLIDGHPFSVPDDLRDGRIPTANRFQKEGMGWWLKGIEDSFGQLTPAHHESMASNDPIAFAMAQLAKLERPDISDQLGDLSVPVLVIASTTFDPDTRRKLRQLTEALPDATFVEFKELNHAEVMSRSDLTLPHIKAFLKRVETERR